MSQKYKTILTRIGKEKMASLIAGEKLMLTHLAVGDGELEPNEEQTSLQNEKYRGVVQKVEISSTKGNRINILGIIPKDVGGFWIREVGVFDSDGDLIAIGNVGETYKSLASDGSDKELGYNVIIEVDNIDNIELEIDESILYVTKKELEFWRSAEYIQYTGNGEPDRKISIPSGDFSMLVINELTDILRPSIWVSMLPHKDQNGNKVPAVRLISLEDGELSSYIIVEDEAINLRGLLNKENKSYRVFLYR